MISYTVQYTDIYVNTHIYEGWWMLCWQSEYGLADRVGEYGTGVAEGVGSNEEACAVPCPNRTATISSTRACTVASFSKPDIC